MTKLLFLDIATVTGFAVGEIGTDAPATALERASGVKEPQPLSGTKHIGSPQLSTGAFYSAYERWLRDMVGVHKPDMIVYEAPFIGSGKKAQAAFKLLGMAAITNLVAYREKVKIIPAHNASIRKHFCGKGNAPRKELKRLVMEECTKRGWTFADDNEADALAGFDFTRTCLTNNVGMT